MTNLSIIVACAQNMAIGKDNALLWHISDDLKRFKQLTCGHTVIMGRNTFESLPTKPLPNRRNIVMTRNTNFRFDIAPSTTGTLVVAHNVEEVLRMVDGEDEVFVMGGAAIYRELLPFVQHLYVTWVYQDYDADIFFPEINAKLFRQLRISERYIDAQSGLSYAYADYVRKAAVTK